jgi:hypothetical protein
MSRQEQKPSWWDNLSEEEQQREEDRRLIADAQAGDPRAILELDRRSAEGAREWQEVRGIIDRVKKSYGVELVVKAPCAHEIGKIHWPSAIAIGLIFFIAGFYLAQSRCDPGHFEPLGSYEELEQ